MDWGDLKRRLSDLAARIAGKPEFRWAIVTATAPLAIRLDGDKDRLTGEPSTTIGDLAIGDRVLVAIQSRRATIVGRSGGAKRVERRRVQAVLAGGSGVANGIYYQDLVEILFTSPFPTTPNLVVTQEVAWGAVQWVQVVAVTKLGFNARVIRLANAPVTPMIHYTATEL